MKLSDETFLETVANAIDQCGVEGIEFVNWNSDGLTVGIEDDGKTRFFYLELSERPF